MPATTKQRTLELKIPPPVVALVLALLMWLASSVAPRIDAPFAWRLGIALALAALGQGIAICGIVAFRRARTTVNPLKPAAASSLVRGGIYRFTRNPMYLGMLLTLLAWAVFLSSWVALVLVPLFVLYMDRYQIGPEERVLSSLFGAEYAAYAKSVRRWL